MSMLLKKNCCCGTPANPCGRCCNWYDEMPISVSWTVTFGNIDEANIDYNGCEYDICGEGSSGLTLQERLDLWATPHSGTTTFKYYGRGYAYFNSPPIIIRDEDCQTTWYGPAANVPPEHPDSFGCFYLGVQGCTANTTGGPTLTFGGSVGVFCGYYTETGDTNTGQMSTIFSIGSTPTMYFYESTCCGFSIDQTLTNRSISIGGCYTVSGSGAEQIVLTNVTMRVQATGTFSQGSYGKCASGVGFGVNCIDGTDANCDGLCD